MARRHRADRQPWWKIVLKVIGGIVIFIFAFYCFSGIINACVNGTRNKYATSFAAVEYENQLTPEKDADGWYNFVTNDDFKIMQFTDVHIGGGYWSGGRDKKALTAVATMIKAEAPDLVVVTGDLAYPVPFQAGTLNNKASAKTFALMMEKLGVYWTVTFGNHDTEAYSYFNRQKIFEFYTAVDKKGNRVYPHCLLTDAAGEVDGTGNQIIKVKNTDGIVTHAIVGIDSHSYGEDDKFGVKWGYDYIKDNQIAWYESEITKIDTANKAINPEYPMVKSTAFFHIPLMEMRDAYTALKNAGVNLYANEGQTVELTANGYVDKDNNVTENHITYFEGTFGEDPAKKMVYSSETRVALFDKMVELGSTQAIFNGHDHLNNCRITVEGIDLVYGMSIDYLAYGKIIKYGRQRGCTVITAAKDTGDITIDLKNYYENYDAPEKEKAKMKMGAYYD